MPVAVFNTVTFAFGTTAPELSVTVPWIEDVVVWAYAVRVAIWVTKGTAASKVATNKILQK
jgi:hypothetical protein